MKTLFRVSRLFLLFCAAAFAVQNIQTVDAPGRKVIGITVESLSRKEKQDAGRFNHSRAGIRSGHDG